MTSNNEMSTWPPFPSSTLATSASAAMIPDELSTAE